MKPINRIPVTTQIAESIKDSIIKGQFKIGEKLPAEQKLCDILGVSRSSIREAMKELQAQGFVELKSGRGAFVRDNQPHDYESLRNWFIESAPSLEEFNQVRQSIEPSVVALATKNATKKEIQELKDLHEKFIFANIENNTSKLANLDEQFHTQIIKMAHNSIFTQINKLVVVGLRKYRIKAIALKENSSNTIKEHERIYNAIEQRNIEESKSAMIDHLQMSKAEMFQIMEGLKEPS